MTDKEIKDLAKSYTDELFKGDDMSDQENMDAYNDTIVICQAFLGHVLESHCIVSRNFVRAYRQGQTSDIKMLESEHKTGERMMRQATCQLRIDTLNALFGQDLFTDKDEKQ